MSDLDLILRTTFGYSSFRPLQREICSAALAGQDVFALLPTGGGKSLCFQLPALAREGGFDDFTLQRAECAVAEGRFEREEKVVHKLSSLRGGP